MRRLGPTGIVNTARGVWMGLMIGALPVPSAAQLAAGGAPEPQGLALAVEQAQSRESNPLRLRPEAPSVADSAWVSAADGTYRHRWGRQQLMGFGRLANVHYSNQSTLNHDTYRLGVLADFETVGDLGVRLNGLRQRDALEGQLRLDPETGQRRLQTLEQLGASLLWGTRRWWTLQSDWQHESVQAHRPQVWWPGYEQDTWRLQIRTDPRKTLFWSFGRRQLEGVQKAVDNPSARSPGVNYRSGTWDLEWSWQHRPGDALTIRGATGHGQREPQVAGLAEGTSPGANITSESAIKSLFAEIRWQPLAKLSVQAMASRDRGQQTQATQSWVNGEGLALQGANDVRQNRVGLQWDVHPRWQLAVSRQQLDRMGEQSWYWVTGQSTLFSPPLQTWQDRLERRTLAISWQVSRRALAQCTARLEERSGAGVDAARATLQPQALLWKDRLVLCSLRWQLVATM